MRPAGPYKAFITQPREQGFQAALSESSRVLSNEQVPIINEIVEAVLEALLRDSLGVQQKHLVLRLSKELLGAVSYTYLVLYEAAILPWIVGVSSFERELPFEQRCQMLFPNTSKLPKQEWLVSCKKLMTLCKDITDTMAIQLLPNAPFQNQPFPSVFALSNRSLASPPADTDFSERFKQQFVVQYSVSDKNRQLTVAPLVKAIKSWLGGLLDRAHWMVANRPPPVKQLNQMLGLLDTGDNHLITAAIDVCRDFISLLSTPQKTKVDTLNFVDSVFLLGDPQILYEIRTKIGPILIQDLLLDESESISKIFKDRQAKSLKLYAQAALLSANNKKISTDRKIYEAISEILKGVEIPSGWQDKFVRNLERRDPINKAKAPLWLGSTSYQEALKTVVLKRLSGEQSRNPRTAAELETISIPVPEMQIASSILQAFVSKNQYANPGPQPQLKIQKKSSLPARLPSQTFPQQPGPFESKAVGHENQESDVNRSDMSGMESEMFMVTDSKPRNNGNMVFRDSMQYPVGESKGSKPSTEGIVVFTDSMRKPPPDKKESQNRNPESKPVIHPNETPIKPNFAFRSAEQLLNNNPAQTLMRIRSATNLHSNNGESESTPQKTSDYSSTSQHSPKQRLFLTQRHFPRRKNNSPRPVSSRYNLHSPTAEAYYEPTRLQRVANSNFNSNAHTNTPSYERDLIRNRINSKSKQSRGTVYDFNRDLLFKETMLKRGELVIPQLLTSPVHTRKRLWKAKELLLRNQVLEVGFICQNKTYGDQPGTVRLDLYYCSNRTLTDFEVDIQSDCITCSFDRMKEASLPSGLQLKQTVEMSSPEPSQSFFFTRPTVTISYEFQNRETILNLELPYTMLKMVHYEPVTNPQLFLNEMISGHLLYTKPIAYSSRLISDPSVLTSIIPSLTLLESEEKFFDFCGAVVDADKPLTLKYGAYVLFKKCRKVQMMVELSRFGMIEVWMLWDRQPPYRTMLKHYISDFLSIVAQEN